MRGSRNFDQFAHWRVPQQGKKRLGFVQGRQFIPLAPYQRVGAEIFPGS
jgi:hypothetical protein